MSLSGRTAVVTGAASGIGAAIADALAGAGATVAGVDRQPAPAGAPLASAHRFDLADLDGLPRLAAAVEAEVGPVDILVNCAGVAAEIPLTSLDVAALRRVVDIDLLAPILLTGRFAEGMVARGYGRVVNITSVHGGRGAAGCVAYDAAKAGLNNVTRSLAAELAPHGVLVNAVAPGFIRTPMCHDAHLAQPWFRSVYVEHARIPLRRAGEPPEVAAAVVWLVSEANTYVTGQVLGADGGLSATF